VQSVPIQSAIIQCPPRKSSIDSNPTAVLLPFLYLSQFLHVNLKKDVVKFHILSYLISFNLGERSRKKSCSKAPHSLTSYFCT